MPRFSAMLFIEVLAAIDVIFAVRRIRFGRKGRNPGIPCRARPFRSAAIRLSAPAQGKAHGLVWWLAGADSRQIAKKHLSVIPYSSRKPGSTTLTQSLWLVPRQSFGATIGESLSGDEAD